MASDSHVSNLVNEARAKARVLERVGRYREAAHFWHLALGDAPDDAELLCSIAYVYYRLNERCRADEYVAKALIADPNHERVHRLRCLLVLGKGKKAAIASALRAVELNPSGRNAWYLLAQSYLRANELENARNAAVHLGKRAPQWAATHETLSEVASRLDKWEAAKKEARAALALNAESVEAHVLLGQCYINQWNSVEAARTFLRAMELEPHYDGARHLLIVSVVQARNTISICLCCLPIFLAVSWIWLPALHFRGWQSCLIGFVLIQMMALFKALGKRQSLPPEVWRAYRIARGRAVTAFFGRVRRVLNKIE